MPKKKDIMQFQRVRRYAAGLVAINAADDATGIGTALAAHGKKLDLDMVAYNGLTAANQAIVDAALLAGKAVEDYADRDALAAVFEPILCARVAAQFAVDMVNAALSAVRMDAVLEQYAEVLGLELDDYNVLIDKNKETVCGDVLTGKPYADEAAVKVAFDAAVATALETQALADINAATAETMAAAITTYVKPLGLDLTDYNELDETGKDAVYAAMVTGQPYADKAAVKTAFDAAVATALEAQALVEINAATADTMGLVITTYAEALGLDLTDYDELEEAKKGEVHTAMVAGQTYADKGAAKTAFDAAVLAAQGE
jgi:hypothetical protein